MSEEQTETSTAYQAATDLADALAKIDNFGPFAMAHQGPVLIKQAMAVVVQLATENQTLADRVAALESSAPA